MATKRPKAPTFMTPAGTLSFPKLSEVDYGSKDYPSPNGVYKTGLILTLNDPATQAFIQRMTPYHEQAVANGEEAFKQLNVATRKKLGSITVNPLYTELFDEETEQPTGQIQFNFKIDASRERSKGPKAGKWFDNRPTVFNRDTSVAIKGFLFRDRLDGETMDDLHGKRSPDIWGGTVAKVAGEIGTDKDGNVGYFISGTGAVGLSLKLHAVQIIDLVGPGDRSASSYGFGNEAGEDDETETDISDNGAADDAGNGDF